MHAVIASTSTPSCSPSSTVPTPSFKDHLSYPSDIDPEPTSEQQQPQQPRQLLKDRLYIGNLHPTVDESVPPLPLHPSNLIIPLQKVLTPSSLFKVWQSFQARFSLPQDRAPQRQAPRVCIYRVRKQRCKCLSPPPSPPPRLSCVMPALRTLLLTLAFPFSRHASHESPSRNLPSMQYNRQGSESPSHNHDPCIHVGREKKRLIISH